MGIEALPTPILTLLLLLLLRLLLLYMRILGKMQYSYSNYDDIQLQ